LSLALKIDGVKKSYGTVRAIESLSLEVTPGELFGLIGPDGAGKTTALRILCGLIAQNSGKVEVFGYNPLHQARQVREIIGYMPQRFSLYPDLSVAENLRFFADLYLISAGERKRREERLMQFSMLAPFRDRRAGQLSGGMKQKLALSCTLIHTPKLLILDEPTTGVDPVSRQEFWSILRDLKSEGIAIIVSTPYMDEAGLCDRVSMMHQGKVLASGTPADMAAKFPFKLIEVASEDPIGAQAALERAGVGGSRIHRFGATLHVSCLTGTELSTIIRQAVEIGLEAREISPSIEDTFVALVSSDHQPKVTVDA
jgi:ABC-2 type transport system ATP-binding protein